MPNAPQGRLILLCGIPGSGKTTIGKAIGERLVRCVHVQSDVMRAMLGKPDYSPGESSFVYAAAASVAEAALSDGYDVILDATFPREEFRREALSRLTELSGAWLVVWVWCDPMLAFQRNSKRQQTVPLESFERIARSFEPPRGALVIDSHALTPGEAAARILAKIGGGMG